MKLYIGDGDGMPISVDRLPPVTLQQQNAMDTLATIQSIMGGANYRGWIHSRYPSGLVGKVDWDEVCKVAYRKLYILTSDCTCLPDCSACRHCRAIIEDSTIDSVLPY